MKKIILDDNDFVILQKVLNTCTIQGYDVNNFLALINKIRQAEDIKDEKNNN